MNPNDDASYGASSFYQGEAGRKYFEYQNRFANTGGQLNAEKFQSYLNPGDIVLDFGCGGGWLLHNLKCGAKYGVELNPAGWPDCENNGVKVHASVALLPEGLQFNRIISHHCLEHVPYPIEALRELRDRLRPTGEMLWVLSALERAKRAILLTINEKQIHKKSAYLGGRVSKDIEVFLFGYFCSDRKRDANG